MATFTVGGHLIGVPSHSLVRAALLGYVSEIPGAAPYLFGLAAFDGHMVTVLDLPLFYDLGRIGVGDIAACVVVQGPRREIGLAAEELFGFEDVPESAITSLPAGCGALRQVAHLPERDVLLLDVEALFNDPRLGGSVDG
jgi:chemotaxis signal transduction protein